MTAFRNRLFALYTGFDVRDKHGAPANPRRIRRTGHRLYLYGEPLLCASASIGDDEIELFREIAQRTGGDSLTIGVSFGLSLATLALVDPNHTAYGLDSYEQADEVRARHARDAAETVADNLPNVRLTIGRSPEDVPRALAGLDRPLGLVFIDAEHTDEAAAADFRGALPFMDAGTVVLWHDTKLVRGAIDGCFGDPFDSRKTMASHGRTTVFWNGARHPHLRTYLDAWSGA